MSSPDSIQGILLIDKPKGKSSYALVSILRRIFGVKKIGHAGTLDPFATGVMVMLVGRSFTRLSDQFLLEDKEYLAQLHLGITTDTYDCEGERVQHSPLIPTLEEIGNVISHFQGELEQVPPMYSAKKINGKKLYELARKGIEVERKAVKVKVQIEILGYHYPHLDIRVKCSKGTYIRSLAYDIGLKLGCGAHLSALKRTKSGPFHIDACVDGTILGTPAMTSEYLRKCLVIN